jgi:orotate phosphoribosyltransferase
LIARTQDGTWRGRLRHLRGADVVVLGLPRGGVPVAFEVAEELHAPLDVIVVGKARRAVPAGIRIRGDRRRRHADP